MYIYTYMEGDRRGVGGVELAVCELVYIEKFSWYNKETEGMKYMYTWTSYHGCGAREGMSNGRMGTGKVDIIGRMIGVK